MKCIGIWQAIVMMVVISILIHLFIATDTITLHYLKIAFNLPILLWLVASYAGYCDAAPNT